jgi:ABC-type nickel/cobalt efflux system permease component RcnA
MTNPGQVVWLIILFLVLNLVLSNLLIAMMSSTYARYTPTRPRAHTPTHPHTHTPTHPHTHTLTHSHTHTLTHSHTHTPTRLRYPSHLARGLRFVWGHTSV